MARPRSPLIDRDAAVRTALELIDRDGLAAFSLEGLGRALNVRAPSLYHHFTDRADLLARVARLVILEVPTDFDEPGLAWDARAVRMTVALRRAILDHPEAIPVVLEFYPRHLTLQTYEETVLGLRDAGLPDELHLLVLDGLEKLALGSVLPLAQRGGQTGWTALVADLEPGAFPAIRHAVSASDARDDDALFAATCAAFIAGVRARHGAPA